MKIGIGLLLILFSIPLQISGQANCISVQPAVCVGDCVPVTYVGSAPSSAIYTWTSTCGNFTNPNQQNPGMHCFLAMGLCTLQLIVLDPGQGPDTCYAFVEVNPIPDGTIENDTTICPGDCASLYVYFLAGNPPFVYQVDDGFNSNIYTSFGLTDTITVCPLFTTTYTLASITSSGNCQNPGPFNSVTVNVLPGVTASVTQSGNMLCANPPNQNYQWWDCNYNQIQSTSQCITMTQDSCYCLIVTSNPPPACPDTICAEYFLPCDITCEIVVDDSICLGDTVIFAYTGNASQGAVFNWLIDLPGFPATPFTGNDTVILVYNQPGCYQVSLTVFDVGCVAVCSDSICVVGPKSQAELCCDEEKCDTCTTLTIILSGAPPWTIYLTDGTTIDTIQGITSSPYLHIVCPPDDSSVTYTLIQVTDSCNICPAVIVGDTSATITLHSIQGVSITQNGDTLCANPPNMAGYGWYPCPAGTYLDTFQCFVPTISGCYCVDISDIFDCVDTACVNFIISSVIPHIKNEIRVYPIPSDGKWNLEFSSQIDMPVEWKLLDTWGRVIESGELEETMTTLRLKMSPSPGIYFLKFISADDQYSMVKVVIQE